MPTEKRNPAAKRSTATKKVRGKSREKRASSLKARLASGTRSERDTGPARSSLVKASFPIVGIGASAGGLEALEAFFENLPAESGMAFVVITHTDPKHTSLLPDILKRKIKKAADASAARKSRRHGGNRDLKRGTPVEHRFPKIGLRKMLLNGRHLREEDPSQNKILLAMVDVTDRH